MRRKMNPILVIIMAFIAVTVILTGCQVRAQITSKPAVESSMPLERRVDDYSAILSTTELFQLLDGFEALSFYYCPPDEYRDTPRMTITVRFEHDVYLGVSEFRLEDNNVAGLKLNLQKLFEEIRNAQEQPGQGS